MENFTDIVFFIVCKIREYNLIVLTLQVYFARSDGHYIFSILQVFLVGLGN